MRDLDIRGSGNLLGAEQSGFIAEIGFEMYHKILDEAIHELKDEEFKGLFEDEKPKPYISFTQIDTDQEILIPDEYVTNIAERYNLYTDLSKLNNEAELEAFTQQLKDRFGPIPPQVHDLLNTIRMQWLGKAIGFEKLSLKKNVLRGYFITNQQSPYFESEAFTRILQFVQSNPRRYNLKEVKDTLRLGIEGVRTIEEATEILTELAGGVEVR
jgi:transcription-repair coupling factor (superfamily II helicase)